MSARSGLYWIFLILGSLFSVGCAGLIPPDFEYRVELDPLLPEGRGDYFVDHDDGSVVFSVEGALIKVKPWSDQELNAEIQPLWDGKHVNPYTSGEENPELGYTPPIFSVFKVTVVNKTYSKIEFDPANALLFTDAGDQFTFYDASRKSDSPNNFRKYYKVELGISGNEKTLALERMGVVYKTAYHRHRPVFRGDQHSGFLAFDPVPQDVNEITLKINAFVLSFDANDQPERTVDCEFRFKVEQGVVEKAVGDLSSSS